METTTPLSLNLFERFNRWMQESIMVKLLSIGFLILILLIPSSWIDDLIYERQQRADEVMNEVAGKWSGPQTVSGPILVIPYKRFEIIDKGKEGKQTFEYIEKAYFLPDHLSIKGTLAPEVLHRGIFDAVVYESNLKVNANFSFPDFKALSVDQQFVQWDDAYMIFGISDHRGISGDPRFSIGGASLQAEPSNDIGISVESSNRPVPGEYNGEYDNNRKNASNGIVLKLAWTGPESFVEQTQIDLQLKGSKRLDFIPTGKTTDVNLSGNWSTPSFDGEFLPTHRNITDSSFHADWKILHFNRPIPQQWNSENKILNGADFGVRLLMPVDQYQKSMRTSKYGVLIILLTFMSLFLVEITQGIKIHPFQYILIGVALIIYYTLLISFSEHMGYDFAYAVSSMATVLLITLYSTTFFAKKSLSILLAILLTVFYIFIYVIILQQDFSLLIGSVGLFIIIGTLMYFSRNVRWYSMQ